MYDYKRELAKLQAAQLHCGLIEVATAAKSLCQQHGVVRYDRLMTNISTSCDSWGRMAVIDRCVELAVLEEIPTRAGTPTQHRLFTWAGPMEPK